MFYAFAIFMLFHFKVNMILLSPCIYIVFISNGNFKNHNKIKLEGKRFYVKRITVLLI